MLRDEVNPFDFSGPSSDIKSSIETPKDSSGSEESDESSSMEGNESSIEPQGSLYETSPKKKLLAKKCDKNPSDTDFEWVTEMLDNKLVEIKDESSKGANDNSVSTNDLKMEESDFLYKAKDLFSDVLND